MGMNVQAYAWVHNKIVTNTVSSEGNFLVVFVNESSKLNLSPWVAVVAERWLPPVYSARVPRQVLDRVILLGRHPGQATSRALAPVLLQA